MQPDNVLVTEFLRAKLSDFGTSRAQGVDSDDVAMTAVGTPLFCAPEILRGEAYDASADVYSFGLLLLAMVRYQFSFSCCHHFRTRCSRALIGCLFTGGERRFG